MFHCLFQILSFISDINRVAHIDDKTNSFKPHSNNDANELHGWGLGTTPLSNFAQHKKRPSQQQQQQHNPNQRFSTTLQKPPINQAQQPQNYQKPQATSHTFNPFIQSPKPQPGDKQRYIHTKNHTAVNNPCTIIQIHTLISTFIIKLIH